MMKLGGVQEKRGRRSDTMAGQELVYCKCDRRHSSTALECYSLNSARHELARMIWTGVASSYLTY